MACHTLFLPATARTALHDLASIDPATGFTPGKPSEVMRSQAEIGLP